MYASALLFLSLCFFISSLHYLETSSWINYNLKSFLAVNSPIFYPVTSDFLQLINLLPCIFPTKHCLSTQQYVNVQDKLLDNYFPASIRSLFSIMWTNSLRMYWYCGCVCAFAVFWLKTVFLQSLIRGIINQSSQTINSLSQQ